ncbi:ceramide synthase 5-like isoform X2 [Coregonus clupeaformis]|uniref:ceramide synthase 5-like isoform X2 n=1 Tax=Coregonus clupeaformis TaxID=59861 RepID=UPI001BE04DB1|nr:ceramide synthase 5-like isoform X2 [Coregonus clupeaformis]
MNSLSAWFWSESFWLPPNVTWAELEHPPPGEEYPRAGHLLSCLPLAFGVLAVRVLFERLVAKPCAHILQIQAGVSRRAQANAVLERVFTSTTSPDSWQIEGLSKQMDWDVRKVQRWFRLRRSQDKPSTLTKFCESMWRLTFYTGIFIYAIRYLWVSPWTWDTRQCWYNYPFQTLSPGQYNYYVAELAFYWSLMLSQFTDIKRKFAKLANYAKYQWICDTGFVVFSIVFFITRLVIYPFWIIYSVLVESWEIIGPYRSWWLLNGLLLVLQTLHVIWFYLIARIAIKAIFKGKVAKDDRSDIESSSEEETDTNVKIRNKSHPNGSEQSLKEGNGTNSFVNGETQDH